MSSAGWTIFAIVVGGLLLAAIKWFTTYATAAIAHQVVDKIGAQLKPQRMAEIAAATTPIMELLEVHSGDLDYIKDELSYNGGASVKDMVHRIERQVESLLTQ